MTNWIQMFQEPGNVTGVCFTSNRKYVFSSGMNFISKWYVPTMKKEMCWKTDIVAGQMEISSDDQYLFIGSYVKPYDIAVVDTKTMTTLIKYSGHTNFVNNLKAIRNLELLITCGSDKKLFFFEMFSGKVIKSYEFNDSARFLLLNRNQTKVLVGTRGGIISEIAFKNINVIQRKITVRDEIWSISMDKTEKLLFTGGRQGVWTLDLATGNHLLFVCTNRQFIYWLTPVGSKYLLISSGDSVVTALENCTTNFRGYPIDSGKIFQTIVYQGRAYFCCSGNILGTYNYHRIILKHPTFISKRNYRVLKERRIRHTVQFIRSKLHFLPVFLSCEMFFNTFMI